MATLKDFESWLKEITRFGNADTHIEHLNAEASETRQECRVRIYTDANCYSIRAVEKINDCGYLGCMSKSRKPRAGEDWHRGSDLADGDLSLDTWRRILADIVSYEMVRLHKPEKQRPVVESTC